MRLQELDEGMQENMENAEYLYPLTSPKPLLPTKASPPAHCRGLFPPKLRTLREISLQRHALSHVATLPVLFVYKSTARVRLRHSPGQGCYKHKF